MGRVATVAAALVVVGSMAGSCTGELQVSGWNVPSAVVALPARV